MQSNFLPTSGQEPRQELLRGQEGPFSARQNVLGEAGRVLAVVSEVYYARQGQQLNSGPITQDEAPIPVSIESNDVSAVARSLAPDASAMIRELTAAANTKYALARP